MFPLMVILFTMAPITAFAAISCDLSLDPANDLLNFGNIDPTSTSNATATIATYTLSCTGNGQWRMYQWATDPCNPPGGPLGSPNDQAAPQTHRMKLSGQSVYLPYSITFVPASGNKFTTTFQITGTVLVTDFQQAQVGSYSDTLTIGVCP